MLDENEFTLEMYDNIDKVITKVIKPRVKQTKKQKNARCNSTIDFVEELTGDKYRKVKKGESY